VNLVGNFLSFHNIWLTQGDYSPHTKEQCIEKCHLDEHCFAINMRDSYPENCYLYRKQIDSNKKFLEQSYLKDTDDSNLIIFFDTFKLLGYAFKLNKVRVKSEVDTRAILKANNADSCMKECQEEALCHVFTYNHGAVDTEKNCFLYSLDMVLCELGKFCNLLEHVDTYMTQFNYYN